MVKVNDGSGSIFPFLSICDLRAGSVSDGQRRRGWGMDTFNGVYVTTNPWESAISPDGKRFYVIYAGTDDMNHCKVIDDDYKEILKAPACPHKWAEIPRQRARQPGRQERFRLQRHGFRRHHLHREYGESANDQDV